MRKGHVMGHAKMHYASHMKECARVCLDPIFKEIVVNILEIYWEEMCGMSIEIDL